MSRQTNWQHRKITQGRCSKCGVGVAYKIVEQDGVFVSREPYRLCWGHIAYSRDYHRNIEPIKKGLA